MLKIIEYFGAKNKRFEQRLGKLQTCQLIVLCFAISAGLIRLIMWDVLILISAYSLVLAYLSIVVLVAFIYEVAFYETAYSLIFDDY